MNANVSGWPLPVLYDILYLADIYEFIDVLHKYYQYLWYDGQANRTL
jgi:hypothetical protein